MDVLVLCRYGDLSATTRQRFRQYIPHMREAGVTLEFAPLFDNVYLERMFSGRRPTPRGVLAAYAGRVRSLLGLSRWDAVIVQYELFPFLPGLVEAAAMRRSPPIVFDMDDAIHHRYDRHRLAFVRTLLGRKLEPVLRRASVALCGNAYLAAYAARFCRRAEIVPTVVDTADYLPAGCSPRTVGWIGSPSTWEYVKPWIPLLQEVSREHGHRALVVGAGPQPAPPEHIDFLPWSEADEVALVQRMGIGIMPLPDTPWARGKCGYKLIQYMACGLPVVASPVGVNSEIVEHGVNGFLAGTPAEWRAALTALLRDEALRRRMGAAGRRKVEAEYSVQVHGPRVARMLVDLA